MKIKNLLCGALLSLFIVGCNKDEDNDNVTPAIMNAQEVNSNNRMDEIADDVLQITELQSNEFEYTMRGNAENFLANCATVTTVQTGDVWVRTIDFGTENCALFTGNLVRGKIIITFNNDWDAAMRTVSYAFENFYHNDRRVEGNRTVVKTVLPNGHPNAVINMDMTVTLPDGSVYHRVGTRVREFTEGYDTFPILSDNVFSITGNWTTAMPSGTNHEATITSPLIVKWNCIHWIVSGSIAYSRSTDSATASLDYGSGECDDIATVTIFGITYNITF